MNKLIHKKMKLFILAIIILIMLCILFINHYSNKLYVKIDNSITEDIIISDIQNNEEEVIADSSVKVIKNKQTSNLKDIEVRIKINNEYKEECLVSVNDKIDIEINNLEESYEVYYSIRNEELNTEYKFFENNFLSSIKTPSKFNLYIKVIVNKYSKEFDMGEFSLYDIVYEHSSIENNKDTEIGTIFNEDGSIYKNEDNSEYLYENKDINKNIVIDNIELVEIDSKEEIIPEESLITEENFEEVVGKDVNLKGNIYVIEETDLTEFDITGHLYIETEGNITIDKDILTNSNLYSITISNSNFTINNESYYYECIENEIKINNSKNEEILIKDVLDNSKVEINENNELTIIKDEISSSFNLN